MASDNPKSGRPPDQRHDVLRPLPIPSDGFFGPDRQGVVEAIGVRK